tara:strand:- start:5346 stop:7142 length:1797 start_codon:yes stop_codon:yes gene_type:complete
MPQDEKKKIPINYTNREFQGIRRDLEQIAERFYPDSFQDFSEASFGSIMLDSVAYVADQLSFYLDYNVNEMFLDTSFQYSNVLRHGRILGYKTEGRPTTFGSVAMYILVPASTIGIGPDTEYLPILKRGSRFTSQNGLNFVLTQNVDFSDVQNQVVVANVDSTTGAPTFFAVKAYGNVVSGFFKRELITCGDFERFKRIELNSSNVSEIVSVTDADGNEYFEVDNLSQDIVYREIPNNNFKEENAPSVMKPFLVSRKFITSLERTRTFLQFGSGNPNETDVVADPQKVALDLFGKSYVTDTTFDPTKLTKNQNFGTVPTNTTLEIVYRVTNPTNSNVAAGGLNKVSNSNFEFKDRPDLVTSKANAVINSLEVFNESPITGDVTAPTAGELKRRIFDSFSTQNRAVTQVDYENLVYRMPVKFGSIKRCSVQRDPDSQKRNLNMYVVSEDSFGKLILSSDTIKKNLKVWINQHRMINDTVDIIDPFIINLGVNFVVSSKDGVNKFDLNERCVTALSEKFGSAFYIGEDINISDMYKELSMVRGVHEVVSVKLVNRTGSSYSGNSIDINKNTSSDGTKVTIPKNAVVEIKYPDTDIKGQVR